MSFLYQKWVVEGTIQGGVYAPSHHIFETLEEMESYCSDVTIASFETRESAERHYQNCQDEIDYLNERNNRVYAY